MDTSKNICLIHVLRNTPVLVDVCEPVIFVRNVNAQNVHTFKPKMSAPVSLCSKTIEVNKSHLFLQSNNQFNLLSKLVCSEE